MPLPTNASHPLIADFLTSLNAEQREFYEERAGVFEFDAALPRPQAEALALLEVIKRDGWPAPDTRKTDRLI